MQTRSRINQGLVDWNHWSILDSWFVQQTSLKHKKRERQCAKTPLLHRPFANQATRSNCLWLFCMLKLSFCLLCNSVASNGPCKPPWLSGVMNGALPLTSQMLFESLLSFPWSPMETTISFFCCHFSIKNSFKVQNGAKQDERLKGKVYGKKGALNYKWLEILRWWGGDRPLCVRLSSPTALLIPLFTLSLSSFIPQVSTTSAWQTRHTAKGKTGCATADDVTPPTVRWWRSDGLRMHVFGVMCDFGKCS